MIEVNNISKFYKKRGVKKKKEMIKALDDINLNIKKGEILGIIGPNGAGKTTLLKILSTLILPDKGEAKINGHDVVKEPLIVKEQIGLLAGEYVRSLYWRLSGRNNLKFFANLRNIWDADERIEYLLEKFNLKNMENELVMKYSTGMKHKLALAIGLLNDPPILFLDEPLTGMDPITSREIKELVKKELKGKTIVWASHNLYEIEEMCDRVALINNGKIVLEGAPKKLKEDYWDYHKILLVTSNNDEITKNFKDTESNKETIIIKTKDVKKTISEIIKIAEKKGIKIIEIKTLKPTLEEIFLKGVNNC